MTTEDDARRLLATAAATIEVDETAPMTLTGLPEPGHRRWPVLAAAAAVVLAIGGGYLVTQQLGDDPAPEPAPAPAEQTDGEPVEQEHVYADDEMPSLLGYTRDEATELLQLRGYTVETRKEHSCDQPAGYVLSSDPGPGTPLAEGDPVRLRVTGGPGPAVRCAEPENTWQQVFDLARFARGLGPAPGFPGEVSIAVGEGEHVELTTAQARDPESWVVCDGGECHSPLAALAMILTRPEEMDGFFASTYLTVTDDLVVPTAGGNPPCLTGDPYSNGLPYHAPTHVYVDYPMDFTRLCPPPPVLQIGWSEDHRIASVRLRLARGETAPEPSSEPTVLQREAADAFVAWASGDGPAPEFADRVRLLQDGGPPFGAPEWLDDPAERTAYSMCSGAPPGACGADPTFAIEHHDGEVVAARGRAYCRQGTRDLPPALAETVPTDLVRLTVPEPRSCDQDLPVEIWVDDEGAIYAVNLTFPPAAQPALSPGNDAAKAARAFVAWARGGPAPAFADRVRIMFHGESNGWETNPERLNTYSFCSGFGYPECGIDPVAMLARYDGTPTVRVGRSSCADGGEVPGQFAEATQDVVRLEAPDPGPCRKAWAVELWIDDDGRIYGANQAGEPVR